MMKTNYLLIGIALATWACSSPKTTENTTEDEHANHAVSGNDSKPKNEKKKPLSPHTSAMSNVDDAHVHIDYSSPGVRGRVIWGGLVAYDNVWVTGAHNATSINFSKDVIIGETKINAGKYGFFTIPGKNEWTVIINKNPDMHGADDYDKVLDVVRVSVVPNALDSIMEHLLYEVKDLGENKGQVIMSWEKLAVPLDFTVL